VSDLRVAFDRSGGRITVSALEVGMKLSGLEVGFGYPAWE